MDNNNTMEYRIDLEKQNKRSDQVTELNLDNCRASQISGLTDEFVNLETLSLINVGLVTLKGFPKLPKLKKLELSDNRLTGGLNLLHGSPKLQHLNISGNRIKDLDALEPLKEFQDLVNLDLYNCEVTKADDYRRKVFDLLPSLHSLDGYDRNEREVADSDESDDEGSDVENKIGREDNDLDEDDEEDDDEDDDDEDEDDEDDGVDDSSEYDEEGYNGLNAPYDEEDDDEEEDQDDGEDEAGIDEEVIGPNQGDLSVSPGSRPLVNQKSVENGDVGDGVGTDDYEDIDDEEDDDDELGEESDLKQLEKDIDENEDSDDDDFEPTHEPDARDYEIDPEDDADEDESSAHLSTSELSTSATDTASVDAKQRGQKRKHEDEGGDEIEDEGGDEIEDE